MNNRQVYRGDLMGRVQRIHFVGVGGAGMSGIAEVMVNLGFKVSGTDLNVSAATDRLMGLGASVAFDHAAEHAEGADVLVVSSAVPADNPEVAWAHQHRIPVVPRAEMLGELMRFRHGVAVAGSHGKTTTTSLLANILAEGGLDPTFVIGGLLNRTGSHARLGSGRWLVAEADESDASFLKLQPLIAIVSNIDSDHMATYGQDMAALEQAFADFLRRLPFYGIAILGIDCPRTRKLMTDLPRLALTYGMAEDADIRARNLQQSGLRMSFEVAFPDSNRWWPMELAIPGAHNVSNALAAMSVAWELGVDAESMQQALSNFSGVGRRFNHRGNFSLSKGGKIDVVDDYGHHPTELGVTIAAARAAWPKRRLLLAFQPHRYSRTRDLFEDFAAVLSSVDALVLTEVYSAGENAIAGADGRSLCRAVRLRGKVDPVFCEQSKDLLATLDGVAQNGDVVLLAGAGNIGAIANQLNDRRSLVPAKEVRHD